MGKGRKGGEMKEGEPEKEGKLQIEGDRLPLLGERERGGGPQWP